MSSLVVVRDLEKRYHGIEAVRGVSFEIGAGEIFGLLGPNGAGKTSILECLVGLREADAGTIEVCGIDARRSPADARQKIGVALQSTALQDKITPREALRLFGSFYREREEPQALIERFSLGEKADVAFDTLSGGQKQRLALALAFVSRPKLVLLDEPTAGLDPQSRRELHDEVRRMKQDGYTVLITTHYLEEAEALCDRVAIIDHGTVLAIGAPRELVARSTGVQSVTLETKVSLRRDALAALPGLQDLAGEGNVVRFRTAVIAKTLAALAGLLEREKVELVELHVQKATLEDIFMGLTTAGSGKGKS